MTDCAYCGKLLKGRKNKKFCDSVCSRRWHSEQWHRENPKTVEAQLKVGTVGSMNVMRVVLDLVKRGYSVYRAAFEAMPFEIVIVKTAKVSHFDHKEAIFVKVTTGHRTSTGTLTHRKFDGVDVMAVVVGDEIVYDPPL